MSPSNFLFLQPEFPILLNIGQSTEFNLHNDPVTCLFKPRQFGERLTEQIFEQHGLEFPLDNNFHSRLETLEFKRFFPASVKDHLFAINEKDNMAVYQDMASAADSRHSYTPVFIGKAARFFYHAVFPISSKLQ